MPRLFVLSCVFVLLFLARLSDALLTLHVAVDGRDSNSGTIEALPLASCFGAVKKIESILSSGGLPKGGIEVQIAPGVYPLNESTACGVVTFRGTKDSPIVFRGMGDSSKVIFDGLQEFNASNLAPVTNATILGILNPAATNTVLTMRISRAPSFLEWNGVPLRPSVWPNEGLGYARKVFDEGAVYAQGRTKGPPPAYSMDRPIGGNLSLAEQPSGDWAAEYAAGFTNGFLAGYFNNDWYKESHRIARIDRSATNTSVQLLEYSRYGICEALENVASGCGGKAPGRFTAGGLLSEVDTPGEWFYDGSSEMLYVYPLPSETGFTQSVRFGDWQGGNFVTLSNSSWVTFRDLTISGVGSHTTSAMVDIQGGDHNVLGGCTLKNSARLGVSLSGGTSNRVIGNDMYDVASPIVSSTPDHKLNPLVPTNNLISNNHFTQVYLRGTYWQVKVTGLGDRFSHNLIHDAPGQVILPGGPLTMLDSNEVFNTGYSEGDGGVMYMGASLVTGYGMSFRENFVHHSLEVPGLHGRGGIYFDDHEQAVSNVSGNVMYKAAGRAFLVNGGAGNNITRNLIVNSGIGIFNQHADDMTKDLPLYDNGTLRRGDKTDYIWKTERALGVDTPGELLTTPFAQRFSTFRWMLSVNSTVTGWASPVRSNFKQNIFLNNSANICLLSSYSALAACDANLTRTGGDRFINHDESTEAEWDWFPGAAQLEFVSQSLGFNTTKAGLICDDWRRSVPAKSKYRPWVKQQFDSIPSAASGSYSPEAASVRAGMRSGHKLILDLELAEACPPLKKMDCEGAWFAWGECELDGKQVMRFTIERQAFAGGSPCSHPDGYAQRMPCGHLDSIANSGLVYV